MKPSTKIKVPDYKVKDMSLASWGSKEIDIAQTEMPGLMALRKEFETKKASDSVFSKSPQAILNWFYNKSPYVDSHKGIYPVVKVYDSKTLQALKKK